MDESNEQTDSNEDAQSHCADYEIAGVVVFVKDAENEEKCNLVAILQVQPPYFERAKQEEFKTGWFLFNDFR